MINPPITKTTTLLTKTFNLFSPNKGKLTNVYVFACQHILRPREEMFSLFLEFGFPKENIFVLGKAYSTNEKLFKELQAEGLNIFQPEFDTDKSFDEQHKGNCERLFELCKKNVPSGSRVIVLDDGGMLLSVFNERRGEVSGLRIYGIEQTSSGFRKFETENLQFPVINVARSATKLNKESPYIAETCFKKLKEYISNNKILATRSLIIGLGPIGKELLALFEENKDEVEGFDIALGHTDLLRKISDFKPDIIIGATGTTCLSKEDILHLSSPNHLFYLMSVSSSDREFSVASFRVGDTQDVHIDVRYKNIVFVNNGFPINFEINREKEGVEKIERTICLLLGSVLYLANIDKVPVDGGFFDVPEIIESIL